MVAWFYLLVVAAGVSVALQQLLNANLRSELGSPWWAGFVSYLGGSLVMLLAVLANHGPWITREMVARTSWPSWTGGLFGAAFIAIAIFMVPKLGAATVMTLLVVGQMMGSLVFDHFGLLGVPRHPINLSRVLGAGCLIIAVLLIRR